MDETAVIFEYFLRKQNSGILVDVGAHYGTTCLPFLEAGWDVYAFEPDPDNYKQLVDVLGVYETFHVDKRAVSDKECTSVPFYASEISSGISSLCSFHETHKYRCETQTIDLAKFCCDMKIDKVDVLKIDTEGYELFVLKGIDWEAVRPEVIICEFEDAKTTCLSYCFTELAEFLESKGYTLYISEWYPVVRYGAAHQWRCFHQWPCELEDDRGWGNIIAFSRKIEDLNFTNAVALYMDKQKGKQMSPESLSERSIKNGLQMIQKLANNHIRQTWTQLLKNKKFRSVLIVGSGSELVVFIKLLNDLAGPEIVGIIDYKKKNYGQFLEGIPFVHPDDVHKSPADAVVLPSNILITDKIPIDVINIFTEKPIIELDDEFPKIDCMRLVRDLNLATNKLNQAKRFGEQILIESIDKRDFEVLYRIGLALHKEKKLSLAQNIYETIANDERAGVELNAWALFKHGELMIDKGDKKKAQILFTHALKRNPNHTKAQIFNVSDASQLKVCLSTNNHIEQNDCVSVPIDPVDEELWEYYFNYRKPDYMSIYLDKKFKEENSIRLLNLIVAYIAPGGFTMIYCNNRQMLADFLQKTKKIIRLFKLEVNHCVDHKTINIKKI